MGYVIRPKCESRCVFPCLHLDRVSDFFFSKGVL